MGCPKIRAAAVSGRRRPPMNRNRAGRWHRYRSSSTVMWRGIVGLRFALLPSRSRPIPHNCRVRCPKLSFRRWWWNRWVSCPKSWWYIAGYCPLCLPGESLSAPSSGRCSRNSRHAIRCGWPRGRFYRLGTIDMPRGYGCWSSLLPPNGHRLHKPLFCWLGAHRCRK